MWKYVKKEKSMGRIPIMDPFNPPKAGPLMGVPLGGIGCGSIGRGWRGDFARWQLSPCGIMQLNNVEVDKFSLFVRRKTEGGEGKAVACVLHPGEPPKGSKLKGWDWKLKGDRSTYYALFPRAWTVYEEPDPLLRATCKQVSPVIPHNYQESSYPAATFAWTLENLGETEAEVSIMFTFQNGTGCVQDTAGGHQNQVFSTEQAVGIQMTYQQTQVCRVEDKDVSFHDPLSFSLAVVKGEGVTISSCCSFVTNAEASNTNLWNQFSKDGLLLNDNGTKTSLPGESIGAALAAKVTIPAGGSKELVFCLAWDCPIARFSQGQMYYKKYTEFFGTSGSAVQTISCTALSQWRDWDHQIETWQSEIISDTALPRYYKGALFNELYYIVDGGSIWTRSDCKIGDTRDLDSVGHFAYLEGLEYLMYNTYDVHFYASFALAMLWPKLEISLQRDIAFATMQEYPEIWQTLHSGKNAPRKKKGAVPHDMGNPGEDPWNKVNSYCIQDISHWKDLPCKFVLQVYRDYVATSDLKFLQDIWEVVKLTIDYASQFDVDDDGVIDNEGFPDQTYDTWAAVGCSAYSGGLWLACLSAASAMAQIMKETEMQEKYKAMREKGMKSYEEKLWNGKYYNYDSSRNSHHDSIMADMMAGQWYAKACGLESIVPEDHARSALKVVFEFNVKGYNQGTLGAINGMRPNGLPDTTCMQSLEVWTGTTYAVAAAMLQQGLAEEAFETASGIIFSTYETLGYQFQTPEAWDRKGHYRACAYMRPLCIWAMQWAWERICSKEIPPPDLTKLNSRSVLLNGHQKIGSRKTKKQKKGKKESRIPKRQSKSEEDSSDLETESSISEESGGVGKLMKSQSETTLPTKRDL